MSAQTDLPDCVLVDLDGTLALRGDRSPYDYSRVIEDRPNNPIIRVVSALQKDGLRVVVITGREDSCRVDSEDWLQRVFGFSPPLIMRSSGDYRPDYVVKQELLQSQVLVSYSVAVVLDDRQQCVDLWRKLGFVTLQVAEGNF